MSVIHNIFVKFLLTFFLFYQFFCKDERARRKMYTHFSIYGISHKIFGVKNLIQKVEKKSLKLLNVYHIKPHQMCAEQYGP